MVNANYKAYIFQNMVKFYQFSLFCVPRKRLVTEAIFVLNFASVEPKGYGSVEVMRGGKKFENCRPVLLFITKDCNE